MTWTELDYRWAVVLWKGREILCRCPVPKLLLNAQERSVIFNWVYHMNLRWVGTYARVCAVMVISSSNHGDQYDDQNDLQIHQILSKSYEWCCFEHQTCEGWLSNLKKLDHRTSEKYAYLSYSVSMTLPGTSNLFRRKNFSLLLFWDCLSEDFWNIRAGLFEKSCQMENFPSDQWSPKPPVQSSKMICNL